jgi:hypothetical protein
VQYGWKAVQWLALTLLITLLLLIISGLRLLVFVPFLQSAAVAGFIAVTDYVVLHWVGSMRTYLLDHTRGAAIRERFSSDLRYFLDDPLCKRVVVVAHSFGTVIAYEGLTTTLQRPEYADHDTNDTCLTFICLAQALRRAWLLSQPDPGRLRDPLPERVQWFHFWARYDPVPAGPLDASALPPAPALQRDVPRATADADRQLRRSLNRCDNIDVVNTDSIFTDHLTYWRNMEQVVGPIAYQLVADHPALQRYVGAHLAGPDAILRRRWRVAVSATIPLLGGLFAAVALLWWELGHGAPIGRFLHHFGPGLLLNLLQVVFGPLYMLTVTVTTATNLSAPSAIPIPDSALDWMGSALAAVAVAAAVIPLIGHFTAAPSPLATLPETIETPETPRGLFLLGLLAVADLPLAVVCAELGLPVVGQVVFVGQALVVATFLWTLIDTVLLRRWGWLALMGAVGLAYAIYFVPGLPRDWLGWYSDFSTTTPQVSRAIANVTGSGPFAEISLLFVLGMGLALSTAARAKRRGWVLVLLLGAALLSIPAIPILDALNWLNALAPLGVHLSFQLARNFDALRFNALIIPALLYALWTGVASFRRPPRPAGASARAQAWAIGAFVFLYTPTLVAIPIFLLASTLLPWFGAAFTASDAQTWFSVITRVSFAIGGSLGYWAWWMSTVDAWRRRRRVWWLAHVLTPALVTILGLLAAVWRDLLEGPLGSVYALILLAITFFVVGGLLITFSYCLWGDAVEGGAPDDALDEKKGGAPDVKK